MLFFKTVEQFFHSVPSTKKFFWKTFFSFCLQSFLKILLCVWNGEKTKEWRKFFIKRILYTNVLFFMRETELNKNNNDLRRNVSFHVFMQLYSSNRRQDEVDWEENHKWFSWKCYCYFYYYVIIYMFLEVEKNWGKIRFSWCVKPSEQRFVFFPGEKCNNNLSGLSELPYRRHAQGKIK